MQNNKKHSFINGASIYLFANILNGIIPFILLPVLTRYLQPEEYGEVAMFQTLLGALSAFAGVVYIGAASRKYFDEDIDKGQLSKFIGSCVQLSILSTSVTAVVFIVFQNQLSSFLSLDNKYVLAAIIVSFSSVVLNLRLSQWQIRKKPIKYGVLQISQSLLDMVLSILFVVLLLKGVSGRIDAQILTSITFLIIAFYLLYKDSLINITSFNKKYLLEAFKFGGPLIFHVSGAFLLLTVDRFIINKQLGLKEVGFYMVALQVVRSMSLVFDAINKAYVPYLYEVLKNNNLNEKKRLVKIIYIWFIVILLGVGLVFLLGPWFVIVFAGEKYKRAGEVIGFLALGQGFRGMYLMVTNFIFYTKKTHITAYITLAIGLINVILLVIMIKFYGLIGAAIANAISMALFFITTWFFAARLIDMPWKLR